MRALGPALALWLAFVPAVFAANQVSVRLAPAAPLFAPVNPQWSQPLNTAFAAVPADMAPAGSLMAKLKTIDWSKPEQARIGAPFVEQLQIALSHSPQSFAAIGSKETMATSVVLAVEEAANILPSLVYQKIDAAKVATWTKNPDSAQRQELSKLMLQLREVQVHYGDYLDENARELLAATYSGALQRVHELQNLLVEAEQAKGENGLAARRKDAAPAPVPKRPEPSRTAVELLERMKQSGHGWTSAKIAQVYTGFGFSVREGGKHIIVSHPVFTTLNQSITYGKPDAGYVDSLIDMIEDADTLYAAAAAKAAAAAAPPSRPKLSDAEVEALILPAALVGVEPATPAQTMPALVEAELPAGVKDPLAPVVDAVPATVARIGALEAPVEQQRRDAPPLAEATDFRPAVELESPQGGSEGLPRRRRPSAASPVESAMVLAPASGAAEELSEPSGVPSPSAESSPSERRPSFLDRLKTKLRRP